ncbi:DsbA family protein [soil metagenome]
MTDDFPPAEAPAPAPAKSALQQRVSGRSVLALVVSVLALGFAAVPWISPDLFGSRVVRSYLISHPEVLDEAVQARQANEDAARVAAIDVAVAANPSLLRADPRDPSFGPANAKVTVIEFFDFRCPGCKAVAADYLRLMKSQPDVRFVFKDWPILDRDGPPVSQYAARAALAAHQQGKYLQVYEALMAQRALTPEAVDQVLVDAGVDLARAKADIASTDTIRHITDIHATANAFKLTGTPTFLINGKTTASIAPEEVLRAIEAAK